MINLGILFSILVLLYAMINGSLQVPILIEMTIIIIDIIMILALRKSKTVFQYVSTLLTAQYTLFFLAIVYCGSSMDISHAWLFTYSTILVYFQSSKKGIYWFVFFIAMLLIAPFQEFMHVNYSFYEVSYLSLVLMVIYAITHFYQLKMEEASALIQEQEHKLILSENILKKELHHRVKNNMQFIISLFKLKLAPYMNPNIQRVLKEVTFKIQGMSNIHNLLYKQKALTSIDASQYFVTLVNALKNGYETEHIKFDMKIEAELSSDQLIFCGLIVNEVVMNAIKHAFNDKKEGGGNGL
ncbi:MAG: hypothetical protein A2019_08495 [Sulfurimonas sp. GWF2_37_8]|nr:MAG: hypothetical protein A2019_08495 [Sulfurimonas sp. GWF2_37_8]